MGTCYITREAQEGKLLEMQAEDPNSRKRFLVYDYCFPSVNFNSDEHKVFFSTFCSSNLFFFSCIVQPNISEASVKTTL